MFIILFFKKLSQGKSGVVWPREFWWKPVSTSVFDKQVATCFFSQFFFITSAFPVIITELRVSQ